MQRIPEPELMDDPDQALAYSKADFSASHGARVQIFRSLYPRIELTGSALDLGCGSGDVLLRFARAYPAAAFYGLDGSQPMLDLAQHSIDAEPALKSRVRKLNIFSGPNSRSCSRTSSCSSAIAKLLFKAARAGSLPPRVNIKDTPSAA